LYEKEPTKENKGEKSGGTEMWNILRFLKTTRCAKNSKKKRPRHRSGAPRVVLSFPFGKSSSCSSGSNNEYKGEDRRERERERERGAKAGVASRGQ